MYKRKMPLHLEQEDHLVAGLSARQILLIGSGTSMGYMVYQNLSFLLASAVGSALALAFAIVLAGSFVLTAFVRPRGRGLEQWLVICFLYACTPKLLLWQAYQDDTPLLEELDHRAPALAQQHEEELW